MYDIPLRFGEQYLVGLRGNRPQDIGGVNKPSTF